MVIKSYFTDRVVEDSGFVLYKYLHILLSLQYFVRSTKYEVVLRTFSVWRTNNDVDSYETCKHHTHNVNNRIREREREREKDEFFKSFPLKEKERVS